MCACVCAKLIQSCLTLCNPMDGSQPVSSAHGDSPGQNTGVGCYALLQGIFPTQGSNQHLLRLLHWQAGSLPQLPTGKTPSLQVITKCQAGVPVLYSSFPLVNCFTHDRVYMSMLVSQFVLLLLPPLCPHVHPLHLCFYSFPANRFISIIFLDSIYMH